MSFVPADIYFDTNVFIEAYESLDPEHSPIWPVLNAAEQGEFHPVTSELTYAELLPKLIADGETGLIAIYARLFSEQRNLRVFPVSLEVLVAAAHLRAGRMSLRLPDAIHLATAASSRCAAILSNDQRLSAAGGVPLIAIGADCLGELRKVIR